MYFHSGAGLVALVHDNIQLPLIESASLKLTPGRAHKLGYKKKTTFLLPAPYTSCSNNVPLPMTMMLDTYYNGADYSYSENSLLSALRTNLRVSVLRANN